MTLNDTIVKAKGTIATYVQLLTASPKFHSISLYDCSVSKYLKQRDSVELGMKTWTYWKAHVIMSGRDTALTKLRVIMPGQSRSHKKHYETACGIMGISVRGGIAECTLLQLYLVVFGAACSPLNYTDCEPETS